MFKVTTRLVASLVLGGLTTGLVACSVTQPLSSVSASAGAGAYGRSAASTEGRVFNLQFDTQTPPVRFGSGRRSAGIAASTDLRPKLSPVDDQGHLGACTGFAAAGVAEYLQRQKGNMAELSPGFVYVLELKADGNPGQDHGSHISTAISVLKKAGIAPEAIHPYIAKADQADKALITKYLSTMPTAEAMAAAAPNKITAAAQVRDLDGFKASIAKGKPVIFGIAVYKSFMSPAAKTTGVIPQPDTANEQLLGGHAIVAVGYDDAKQQVTFRNSWSPTWGDQGYGYLPYSYFKDGDLVHDAWQAN
ncbi:MAG: C1 family peptidase [Candidatus Sericytochromatia bacterium]|nr:C1 family peptidase [Candidatus Sericytochromatia bacterium]